MGPDKGRQEQKRRQGYTSPGALPQLHAGAEEARHLSRLPGHGQIADQQGDAVDRLLQMAGDGQQQAGQEGEELAAEQAVGQGGHQELGQQQHQIGVPRRTGVASHPRQGRRRILEGDQLAQVDPGQGQQEGQQAPPSGVGTPVPPALVRLQRFHFVPLPPFAFFLL